MNKMLGVEKWWSVFRWRVPIVHLLKKSKVPEDGGYPEVILEILTDVDGVYTADPKIVPDARRLKEISYEEMLELASQGSAVIHPRAVELAWIHNIPIRITSSFIEGPGTLIHNIEEAR